MTMLSPLLALVAFGAAMPAPTSANIAWVASGEFCEPETVLPLPDDTLLVSNMCVSRKQGNGFLTLLSAGGEAINWRIVDGLDAPLGMALVDEQLYVVDNNRVKVFHWPDYRLLETIELDASVANDIAVTPDGTIYVTDIARNQVIRQMPDGNQSVFGGEARFRRANGIHIDDENLYVGGERLWRVNLDTGVVTTIGPEWITDIDGIEIEADGTLQITPAAGPLIRYRSDDDFEILGGDGVSSANHGYAANLKLALIPTGYDNTVIAIRIEAIRTRLRPSGQ
jgi:sugar lactone lactonase YvrE